MQIPESQVVTRMAQHTGIEISGHEIQIGLILEHTGGLALEVAGGDLHPPLCKMMSFRAVLDGH
ncbi:hypothetical protein D3C71_1276370 [compost metagenome]